MFSEATSRGTWDMRCYLIILQPLFPPDLLLLSHPQLLLELLLNNRVRFISAALLPFM
uniref:Uncharacterized protein n=1 Tax=Triticum urartu TaxID=4572 RepID=A0A8R7NXA1_TRIUA